MTNSNKAVTPATDISIEQAKNDAVWIGASANRFAVSL